MVFLIFKILMKVLQNYIFCISFLFQLINKNCKLSAGCICDEKKTCVMWGKGVYLDPNETLHGREVRHFASSLC